jgi:glyoxylase-like metal-dependent hydrolase (beta-lactamase superfamily II)
MDGLDLKVFVLGDLFTNCYLIFNKENKKGFLIDAPGNTEKVRNFIEKNELNILFLILTHGHFDHIEDVDKFSQPFYIHKEDIPFLKNADINGSMFFSSPITVGRDPIVLREGVALDFGGFPVEVIHTPGHTPGSVSLKLDKWLFSGDTLFFNSVGRTDVPLASQASLIKSIKEKIFVLSPDTVIYPGHGPSTTVEREAEFNPFLK